jgi:hypothetical protein
MPKIQFMDVGNEPLLVLKHDEMPYNKMHTNF